MFDVRVLLFIAVSFTTPLAAADGVDGHIQRSRAMAQELMASLKQRLQEAMSTGGPVKAVDTCKLEAGAITAAVASAEGWSIRRTSLRVRNTDNAPDEWESATLAQFESRHAAGEAAAQLEHYAVLEDRGRKIFRWMKAIPTAAPCVTCHGGESVAGDLAAAIDRLYPHDQARGFDVGDIRGAFSVRAPAP